MYQNISQIHNKFNITTLPTVPYRQLSAFETIAVHLTNAKQNHNTAATSPGYLDPK